MANIYQCFLCKCVCACVHIEWWRNSVSLCAGEFPNCREWSDLLSEKTRNIFVRLSSCCFVSWSYSFYCLPLLCLHIAIAKAWSSFIYGRIKQKPLPAVMWCIPVETVTPKILINTDRNVRWNYGVLVQLMSSPFTRPSLFASTFCHASIMPLPCCCFSTFVTPRRSIKRATEPR